MCDYRLSKLDGPHVLAAAKARSPRGYRVLMTGYAHIPAGVDEARAAGVDAYLQKPLHVHDLVSMLNAFVAEDRAFIRRWCE